ncbi:unnamed protein product [Urochloa decumbens]|uniref:Serine aminopeptidase S33 domain-containing protein n=1 Tax=Urochloa decumbens TaxID=240449 RepID=A0ABC8ZIA4_9POAL
MEGELTAAERRRSGRRLIRFRHGRCHRRSSEAEETGRVRRKRRADQPSTGPLQQHACRPRHGRRPRTNPLHPVAPGGSRHKHRRGRPWSPASPPASTRGHHCFLAQFRDNIKYEEDFFVNSRGNRLFTCRWMPKALEPRALIFICHGYGAECSISMGDTAARLVHSGFAVYGIDHEGHGKSSGSKGYISNFSDVVKDCSDHFKSVCEKQENRSKKRFLYGFSMGGTVVLQLHRKDPLYWDGAVLLAPACKIFDSMRPHPIIVSALKMISTVAPSWRVIPATDMIDKVCKDPQFKKEIRSNPYMYRGNLALQTGRELLSVTLDIEKNLHEVSLPFLVVHGTDDVVADPYGSKLLHERASSRDKTLKLYPGMWHVLMGEPPEDVERVFADVISWLEDRALSLVQNEIFSPITSKENFRCIEY